MHIVAKATTLFLSVALLGAGCVSNVTTPPTNEPIKLGFIGPLTGDVSTVGVGDRAAAELAIEDVNASGGINGRKVEMIYEDGKCTPATAVSAAQKLMNVDKVIAIVGGLCSSETAAFAPAAMQQKTLVISYGSSAPNLSSTGKYFSRTYPSDAYQGVFAAEYAFNVLHARKVAILFHISDAGTGLKDTFSRRFTELGGTIVAVEGTSQETRDYRTELAKIKASNPDMVFFPLYVDGAIIAIKQAEQLGLNVSIYGDDAFGDPKLQQETKNSSTTLLYSEVVTAKNEAFAKKLLAKTGGTQVPVAAPQTYDAVMVLTKAIAQVGTDPDALAQAVRATHLDGVSGTIAFDKNGDLVRAEYRAMQIKNGGATEAEK